MNTIRDSVLRWGLAGVLALLYLLSLGWLSYGNYRAGSTAWQMAVNAVLLSIPLLPMYASIGLLAAAWQRRRQGAISARMTRLLYWAPRAAGISITLFVAMFALDMFYEGGNIWEMLLGFIIHAMPAILIALILVLAWRREWVGFAAFLSAAVLFLRFSFDGSGFEPGIILLFSGPMAVIALLFWVNWRWRKDLRPMRK